MWYDFSGSICPKIGMPKHGEPSKCNPYVTDADQEPNSDFLTGRLKKGVGNMTKRFKKLLSALCIIALLVSSIATVFANGDPEAEVSAAQEPIAEVTATESNETQEVDLIVEEASSQEAAPAAEEAPAQETTPAVEEAPAQETAPTVEAAPAVEEAPAQETTPVVEEDHTQENAPAVEEAPTQEAAPAIEETPVQKTTPAEEEGLAQETAPAVEEAPAQNNDADTEAAPAQDEAPVAKTAPAQEDAPAVNAAPVQEDAPAADDDIKNNEESVADTDTTPADDYDELANEPVNYKEEDLVELEGAGYMDPEYLDEEIGEITPEMKYTNISEMKIGSTVSGSAGANENFYYIKASRTQNIVLVLQESGNIRIRINEHDVNFIENEDGTKTYEMKVQSGSTYIIGISGNGSFRLTAEEKAVEETAEETTETNEEENATAEEESSTPASEGEASAEDIDNNETTAAATDAAEDDTEEENAEAAEDNIEADSDTKAETENAENNENLTSEEETAEEGDEETEQTEVEESENAQETSEETVENNAPETTEDDENAVEETEPAVVTWVTATVNEDGSVTVYANADIELDNQIVWQTRSADSDEWKKAGYGMKLTVEVNEENADNFFRFRLADGEYSPEHQIHANVIDAAEETEEAVEGNADEAEAAEETVEAVEGEEAVKETADEEEYSSEETADNMEETVSEESAEDAEETEESADEAEVNDDEADTKAEETEETESEEEETEEETEEEVEEEAEPLTEEQLIELGYRKIQIMNQNGTALYDSTADEAAVIGNAETGAELWIKDAEAECWAEIYSEDGIQKFLKLPEIEKQLMTEEKLIELGYRKIQIMNQNGTDIYDSITEEAVVIGNAENGTELWIKDAEAEGWAEIYSENEVQKFLKLAEIEKQMPSDEEMLEAGYIKTYVAIDIGANIYAGLGEEAEVVDHVDVNTDYWVMLIEGAERALIYNLDENVPVRYISLVDIIATMKPEGMENLPTRALNVISSAEKMNYIFVGTKITFETELVNFLEDDHYTVQWKYSIDGKEFIDIDGANDLTYEFTADWDNANYTWRVSVVLITAEE